MVRLPRQIIAGFTLVEMLMVIAVTVVIFGALLSSFQFLLELSANSKAKVSATSLAVDRMEYFRSLPYDDVGTVSGIPPGIIPQNSTTTLNGIEFNERVLVEYVDDPADGELTATTTDSNGIPADYKRIKIEISWTLYNEPDQITLVSNIVPRSIESTAGGGTVRVNVIDADSTPLVGATVQLLNTSGTSTIDVTKYTDSSGSALFSGTPAGSNYQVFVSNPGYSIDQTYEATALNPNPVTSPFTVLEADISTVTFQIGALSDVEITTYSNITDEEILESFSDMSGVATSSGVSVSGGNVALENFGTYVAAGNFQLAEATPASLANWEAISVAASVPVNTEYKIHLYTVSSSTYTLIPEADLPGNAAGFIGPIIDISNLDSGSYPSLVLGAELSTSDNSVSPTLDELALYYRDSESIRSGVSLSLQGNKIIGTELDASPIYKTDVAVVTNGSGNVSLTDIEFDTYSIVIPGSLTVARACPSLPFLHLAGVDSTVELELIGAVSNSLLVKVLNGAGTPVPGATVNLQRTGFDVSVTTDSCGQAFFATGVTAVGDYTITTSKPGFGTEVVTPYGIDGNNNAFVILNES